MNVIILVCFSDIKPLTLVVDIEILQMYSSESESIPDVFTVEAIYGGARVVFINCG